MNARLYVLVKNKYRRNEISLYTCVSMRHNMQRLMFLGKDVLQEKNYIFTIKTSSTYIYYFLGCTIYLKMQSKTPDKKNSMSF